MMNPTALICILLFANTAYSKKCPSFGKLKFDYIGPFPRPFHLGGGDPLEAFGGINKVAKLRHSSPKEIYASELVDGGIVQWNSTNSDEQGKVKLEYSNFRIDAFSSDLGWGVAASKTSWAIAEFRVPNTGEYRVKCTTNFNIDDINFQGDKYANRAWWGDNSWLEWPIHLRAGTHELKVHAAGSTFQCSITCPNNSESHLYALKATTPSVFNPGLVDRIPDLVDGKLVSSFLSFPIVNVHPSSVVHFRSSSKPKLRVLSIDGKPIQNAKENSLIDIDIMIMHSPQSYRVQPGQAFPLPFTIGQYYSESITSCKYDNISIEVSAIGTFENGKTESVSKTLNLFCKQFGNSFTFTFPDVDNSIQYAAAIPPKEKCTHQLGGKCPVVFATHGAGVDASSRTWTSAFDREDNAWILLPTNRGKYGYDWQGIGRRNGIASLRSLAQIVYRRPQLRRYYNINIHRLLFTGHSMGGHGCLVYSTNYADQAIGSACVAGWIRFDQYLLQFQNIGTSFVDPAMVGILRSAVATYHTDVFACNLKHIPFLGYTGTLDRAVNPWNLRRFVRVLEGINGEQGIAMMKEEADEGHWWGNIMRAKPMKEFFKKILSNPLKPTLPTSFRVRAGNLWSSGRGGIAIRQFHSPSLSSWIDVTITPFGIWNLRTVNVRRIELKRLVDGLKLPLQIKVKIDGYTHKLDSSKQTLNFCQKTKHHKWKRCSNSRRWEYKERSQYTEGPARQVYDSPVVIVYGTCTSNLKEKSKLKEHALNLANSDFWRGHSATMIYSDVEVKKSPKLLDGKNVIVIGSSNVNSFSSTLYHRSTAKKSSKFYSNGHFQIGDYSYSDKGIGFLIFGAFDLSGNRRFRDQLFVLVGGTDMDGLSTIMSTFPSAPNAEIPDYMVVNQDFKWQSAGGILGTGYFGNFWRVRKDLSYPRE